MYPIVSTAFSGRCAKIRAAREGVKPRLGRAVVYLGAALSLTNCSYVSDALWPSLTGSDPRSGSASTRQEIPPSAAERNPQPTFSPASSGSTTMASSTMAQAPVMSGGPATEVGRRASQMREEVQRLNASVSGRTNSVQQVRVDAVQIAQRYQGLIANINARLQVGTTPGNPILQGQWNQANVELDRYAAEIGQMTALSNQVAADAATAAFLLESVRAAYSLSGAVEEDHRALAGVEDEVNRTVVSIDRMLNELSEDISRQSAYVSRERSNMTALSAAIKNGELYGTGLGNRAFSNVAPADGSPARVGVAPGASPSAASPSNQAAGNRPLVVIRFDRQNPSYEQALYTAVSRAIERRPNAVFDLVAVSPGRGNQAQIALAASNAKRQAETVARSLTDMGLPPDRVSMSASTSAGAQSNEVHVFVR
jgi:hypothetical protein